MNKPKSNREDLRKNSVTVMLTEEEKERIYKQAHKLGLSMSSFIKFALISYFREEERGNADD